MAVAKFHILAQIFISLLGGVLLLAIWYNIRQRFQKLLEDDDNQKRVDKGLVFLSLAMFIWVLSGIWTYVGLVDASIASPLVQELVRSLFSILNNLFFLLALSYFYYAPAFLYKNDKNVQRIIFLIIGVSALSFLLFLQLKSPESKTTVNLRFLPDLLLSGFLSGLLAVSFYRTFLQRGFKLIAGISVLVIVMMFASQLPEVFVNLEDNFIANLLRIVSKTSLIAIFLVLATSWVIQLANTPKASEMQLKFLDWSIVKITIPSKDIIDKTIDFGSKTTQYKNLLKFGIRRKYAEGSAQCIEVFSGGEIKSQTYLTRILENINDIISQPEAQKLERRDLFTFIGTGKYRLRILPENISIEKTLLDEFIKSKENKAYQDICNKL